MLIVCETNILVTCIFNFLLHIYLFPLDKKNQICTNSKNPVSWRHKKLTQTSCFLLCKCDKNPFKQQSLIQYSCSLCNYVSIWMNRKNSPFKIFFNRDLFPGKVEVDIMQMGIHLILVTQSRIALKEQCFKPTCVRTFCGAYYCMPFNLWFIYDHSVHQAVLPGIEKYFSLEFLLNKRMDNFVPSWKATGMFSVTMCMKSI